MVGGPKASLDHVWMGVGWMMEEAEKERWL